MINCNFALKLIVVSSPLKNAQYFFSCNKKKHKINYRHIYKMHNVLLMYMYNFPQKKL